MAKIAKSYHSYTCNMLQCSVIPSLCVRPSAGPVCFSAACRLRRLRKKVCPFGGANCVYDSVPRMIKLSNSIIYLEFNNPNQWLLTNKNACGVIFQQRQSSGTRGSCPSSNRPVARFTDFSGNANERRRTNICGTWWLISISWAWGKTADEILFSET